MLMARVLRTRWTYATLPQPDSALCHECSAHLPHKLDHFPLRPAPIIAIPVGLPNKRTMPAVSSLDISEVRIASNLLQGLGPHANEWIIGRMNNESRHGNPVHNIRRRRARVIVVGAGKSAVRSGDAIIEEPQTRHAT